MLVLILTHFVSGPPCMQGLKFVVTGVLTHLTREQVEDLVMTYGGKVCHSATVASWLLVCSWARPSLEQSTPPNSRTDNNSVVSFCLTESQFFHLRASPQKHGSTLTLSSNTFFNFLPSLFPVFHSLLLPFFTPSFLYFCLPTFLTFFPCFLPSCLTIFLPVFLSLIRTSIDYFFLAPLLTCTLQTTLPI